MKYEVQHYTLCDGWINTWTICDGDIAIPQVFDTREEAQAELNNFFREIAEEIEYGERDPDNGYDAEEFSVVGVNIALPSS